MKKNGISLIVLIITIIVVIILAAVVILTLSKNNPIESAKEARFKEDVRTFQDELSLYISKQYANAGGQWDGRISAKTYDEIVEYIPSFTKKYEGKFVINNNNLEYTNKLDVKEKEYAKKLNVKKKESILPDEYQQVEYIKSQGTQYIDTKFCDADGVLVKYSFLHDQNSDYLYLVGSHNEVAPFGRNGGYYYGKNKWQLGYGELFPIVNYIIDESIIHNIEFSTILNDVYLKVDEVEIIRINNQQMEISSNPILVFSSQYSLNVSHRGTSKSSIYSAMVFDSKLNKKRDFIPCYSTTTVINAEGVQVPPNTKGLYDLVEGKFYTNQGTGEDFIAGPDVNE